MNKAQVSLFVVVGILIVATGVLVTYFQLAPQMPVQARNVEDYLTLCVSDMIKEAISTAGSQAGYLEPPELIPGSDYAPFSSQFFFLGSAVPYWFYMSGNGIQREQIPSLNLIQKQVADYVKNNIGDCNFDAFAEQGYSVVTEAVKSVNVFILADSVVAEINYPITVRAVDVSKRIESHRISVSSSFGTLYSDAKKIYDYEKSVNFLERYSIDALTLNAPTTDVVLSCAPKAWSQMQIENDVKKSLEANIPTIKTQGNYYNLVNDKYFIQNIQTKEQVNFVYSTLWPLVFEVWPSENGIMRADPIGMQQEGLGILGFCYVPYHFVYSVRFPVMVQLIDGDDFFQFPVVVIIDRNKARQANVTQTLDKVESPMCGNKIQEMSVTVLNSDLDPVNASISYKCHTTTCSIGSTDSWGEMTANFPQCVNGFVVASASGYKITKMEVTPTETSSVTMIMPKIYELNAQLLGGGAALDESESAIVTFMSQDYSYSLYWPVQKSIKLVEGSYNVTAFIFKNGNIALEAQKKRQCTTVPADGFLGMFGMQTENCFDLEVPASLVSQVVVGGGRVNIGITEDELKSARILRINAPVTEIPKDMLGLQKTYEIVDASSVDVTLI